MKAVAITDIGNIRKSNQDTVYCSETALGSLPNLFMVADGMGGEKAGDYASKTLVVELIDYINNHHNQKAAKLLTDGIAYANKYIYSKSVSDTNYEGMGTTLVAAYIDNDILYTINIGDSRLYLFDSKKNKLTQISKDHSFVEEMISMGMMKKGSPDYIANKNKITRAVGIDNKVTPDFFDTSICDDDIVLLCSDGLTNMVPDIDIEKIMSEGTDLDTIANSLVSKAKNNGGKDNISLILVSPSDKEVR